MADMLHTNSSIFTRFSTLNLSHYLSSSHSNFSFIRFAPRRRRFSHPSVIAKLSSNPSQFDIISRIELSDGSIIFKFGDASEVSQNAGEFDGENDAVTDEESDSDKAENSVMNGVVLEENANEIADSVVDSQFESQFCENSVEDEENIDLIATEKLEDSSDFDAVKSKNQVVNEVVGACDSRVEVMAEKVGELSQVERTDDEVNHNRDEFYIGETSLDVEASGVVVSLEDKIEKDEVVVLEEEIVKDEIVKDESIKDEVEDEIVKDENVEDRFVKDEIVKEESVKDEVEDEIVEDEVVAWEDNLVKDEAVSLEEVVKDETVKDEVLSLEGVIVKDEIVEDKAVSLEDETVKVEVQSLEDETVKDEIVKDEVVKDKTEKVEVLSLEDEIVKDEIVNDEAVSLEDEIVIMKHESAEDETTRDEIVEVENAKDDIKKHESVEDEITKDEIVEFDIKKDMVVSLKDKIVEDDENAKDEIKTDIVVSLKGEIAEDENAKDEIKKVGVVSLKDEIAEDENVKDEIEKSISDEIDENMVVSNEIGENKVVSVEDETEKASVLAISQPLSVDEDDDSADLVSKKLEAEPILDEESSSDLLDDVVALWPSLGSNKVHDATTHTIAQSDDVLTENLVAAAPAPSLIGSPETDFDSLNEAETSSPAFSILSAVASLTHSSEALTGGKDAHFISENWFGVADGIGQWSLEGVDMGLYAHEFMQNCEKLLKSMSAKLTNVKELLQQSAAMTQSTGAARVLIAQFADEVLHVANIGDSGFVIIRNGSVFQKSSPMVHEFSFPYAVGLGDDSVEDAEEYHIDLEDGDMIVTATDGLFDNLYEQEIAAIVSKAVETGMCLQDLAELLVTKAEEVGRSESARSPFADAAQAAGHPGYSGGKLDHVTVIVSLVQRR